MNSLLTGGIVFSLMFITDVCWVLAVRRIKDGHPFLAATWGSVLMLSSGLVTFNYTHNLWMLLPTCGGSFAGTYLGVWWDTRPSKTP